MSSEDKAILADHGQPLSETSPNMLDDVVGSIGYISPYTLYIFVSLFNSLVVVNIAI